MRLLLDEDVPQPLLFLLKHLLRGHTVEHVSSLGWKGKKDAPLFRDAKRSFDAILTNNIRQFNDPAECRATTIGSAPHLVRAGRRSGRAGDGIGRDMRRHPIGHRRIAASPPTVTSTCVLRDRRLANSEALRSRSLLVLPTTSAYLPSFDFRPGLRVDQ